MLVPDTLGFLAGGWRLNRSLTDHLSGVSGVFSGTADFGPVASGGTAPFGPPGSGNAAAWPADRPGALSYLEEGELRFGTHAGPATRSLTWLGVAGAADVRFPGGRPFCLVDLRAGSWNGDHPCHPDSYLISYRVLGPDQFEERWRVRGPAKDYDAAATFTRLTRSAAGG